MKTTVLLLSAALAACGGNTKTGTTTPTPAKGSASSDPTSMQDTGIPTGGTGASQAGGAGGGQAGGNSAGAAMPPDPIVTFPNADPDPVQAKAQVDQHLTVAKAALSSSTPDGDTALREARAALALDAASVDAAAYVAYAYYAKKQLDTAELVLDELFKRPTAKTNANVYYIYGLVYDHTNRPEQAVLAFKQATTIDPNFASAWIDLGVHQLQNKQYADATQTFEKATRQFNRTDAVTLTNLGSAYRGSAGDFPPGSGERTKLIQQAEAAYKRSQQADPNYGPAYYNLALLYLDFDPFPSGAGTLDPNQRIEAAKAFLNQYKNMPGVDMKLFDERMKDVAKAEKRAKKAAKSKKGGA
jgi:tetratricopeptide (TPR) repeat protein